MTKAYNLQGIWIGTPWIGSIQNSGLFWIGVWSFQSNLECNPECNPKLRPILDLDCGLHSKLPECSNALHGRDEVLLTPQHSSPSHPTTVNFTINGPFSGFIPGLVRKRRTS